MRTSTEAASKWQLLLRASVCGHRWNRGSRSETGFLQRVAALGLESGLRVGTSEDGLVELLIFL